MKRKIIKVSADHRNIQGLLGQLIDACSEFGVTIVQDPEHDGSDNYGFCVMKKSKGRQPPKVGERFRMKRQVIGGGTVTVTEIKRGRVHYKYDDGGSGWQRLDSFGENRRCYTKKAKARVKPVLPKPPSNVLIKESENFAIKKDIL